MTEKACRNCHFISDAPTCPKCKNTSMSDDFSGLVIVVDPKDSSIAQAMKITTKGRYTLRTR